MNCVARGCRAVRHWLAWLNGDTAYRRYCASWQREHAGCTQSAPPDRAAFYRAELERRWSGIRRCC